MAIRVIDDDAGGTGGRGRIGRRVPSRSCGARRRSHPAPSGGRPAVSVRTAGNHRACRARRSRCQRRHPRGGLPPSRVGGPEPGADPAEPLRVRQRAATPGHRGAAEVLLRRSARRTSGSATPSRRRNTRARPGHPYPTASPPRRRHPTAERREALLHGRVVRRLDPGSGAGGERRPARRVRAQRRTRSHRRGRLGRHGPAHHRQWHRAAGGRGRRRRRGSFPITSPSKARNCTGPLPSCCTRPSTPASRPERSPKPRPSSTPRAAPGSRASRRATRRPSTTHS